MRPTPSNNGAAEIKRPREGSRGPVTASETSVDKSVYKFLPLPYAYDALEPFIDAKTMEVHYSKHHKTYFDKFTDAIKDSDMNGQPLEKIFSRISTMPKAIRNNAGGYWNHFFFWSVMAPKDGQTEPTGNLKAAITNAFGTLDKFKEEFGKACADQFGSGWAWLVVRSGKLDITATPNQDNPLMDAVEKKGTPILGCDVWEHAYYLKYQNKRPDYVKAWWNVVNWQAVEQNYERAMKGETTLLQLT